jgi:type I restriction-modification system DNA methylase subunit
MPLFQQSVIRKHIESFDAKHIEERWNVFKGYFHSAEKQQNIRNSKEEQYQEGFLRDLFVNVLGYTINPEPNFNLLTEQKNITNSKKADGAIIVPQSNGSGSVVAVIELKGTETTDLNKIETQAFGYKNNQPGCNYVVTSNFEKLRFYIDNTTQQEEFNLFTLTKAQFEILYACLSWESIRKNTPMQLLNESVSKENTITKNLYKDYSEFKRALFANMVELNPHFDKLVLFKKTQKLLDRFLFIFFAEDRGLLPTNLIFRINQEWKNLQAMRIPVSLYERYKIYFNDLNHGAKVSLPAFGKKTGEAITQEFEIFAYNGGLFVPDEILDNIQIDDALLHLHSEKMSHYDFQSDVDVNILGHIFENSLNEIDEIKSEIEGNILEKTKTRRKKDGVFYTPKYITKYIVDNTVGKLCTEKKEELKLNDEDFITDKKLQTKTKKALLDKLSDYRNWLLDLTICDPACGSGAFLNQALEFLIAEHRYVDELQAKLLGDSMILSDIENSILERNIYGVDLNDESVEIAKLSLWLRTAQKGRKLNSLNNNIKCGNSLIDDPKVAGDKAFSWENEFPEVFAKGGFDVVIGNPPYVRQELLGQQQKDVFSEKYKNVFNGIADLYVYFYDLSISILKKNGMLGFITPNKWMERKYGHELRSYLIHLDILQIINFGELKIFEDASTEPEITILKNSSSDSTNIEYKMIKSLDEAKRTPYSLSSYDKNKLDASIWRFKDNKSYNIIEKFKNTNMTLNKYTKKGVFYGIKTGLNEAFIINEEIRNEIVNSGKNDSEIIKKMVEGDDFSRWSLNHSGRYMIATQYNLDIPKLYPSIHKFLMKFEEKLIKRQDKGTTHWNLRSCDYYDELLKPKLIYYHTASTHNFYFDTEGYYISANCYFIANADRYLQCVLNSKLFHYVKKFLFPAFGDGENGGRVRLDANKMSSLPVKEVSNELKELFKGLAEDISILSKEFDDVKFRFRKYFITQYNINKLPGKLSNWYNLEFIDFIKELNKAIKGVKGTPLTKKDEFEWMDLFEENKKKALELKAEIDNTDKEIDQMVYQLYGLTEDEIKIVENS